MVKRTVKLLPAGLVVVIAGFSVTGPKAQTAPQVAPQIQHQQSRNNPVPLPYWMQPKGLKLPDSKPDGTATGRAGQAQNQSRYPQPQQGRNGAYRQGWAWTPFGTFTRQPPVGPGFYYTPYSLGTPNQIYGYVPPVFPAPPFFPNAPWGGYTGPGYGYQPGYGTQPHPQN